MEICLKGEKRASGFLYVLWIGTAVFAGVFVFSFATQAVKISYGFMQGIKGPIAYEAQTARASAAAGIIEFGQQSESALTQSNIESDDKVTESETNEAEIAHQEIPSVSASVSGLVEENRELKITFVGDIMLDRSVEESVYRNGDGDFSFIFENLSFLKESDIVFGNLEGPVSDKGEDLQNLYSFRMDTAVIPELSAAGFNILSVANNHSGDWGADAFEDTLSRLAQYGILFAGGGRNRSEAERAAAIEIKNTIIGFLAFSDIDPKVFEAGESVAGILYANDPNFENIIERASEDADILVVSLHFGEEYRTEPTEKQRALARAAIDAGADIIAGHHSHVVQGIEEYKDGVIAYGLGNFIFDQSFSEETMKGLVLDVTIKDGGIVKYKEREIIINEFFQPSLKF